MKYLYFDETYVVLTPVPKVFLEPKVGILAGLVI